MKSENTLRKAVATLSARGLQPPYNVLKANNCRGIGRKTIMALHKAGLLAPVTFAEAHRLTYRFGISKQQVVFELV